MSFFQISPSILAADFANLSRDIKLVEKSGISSLHLDIMDGHFVPNISFGPVIASTVRKITDLELWAHLMIEEPDKYIEPFVKTGVNGIVFHVELEVDHLEIIHKIKENKIKSGIAINPETDVSKIEHLLDAVDRILIMSVHPGFGGQEFIKESIDKIVKIKKMIKSNIIVVDGGVTSLNAAEIVNAGADILVAGYSVFKHSKGPAAGVEEIRTSVLKMRDL